MLSGRREELPGWLGLSVKVGGKIRILTLRAVASFKWQAASKSKPLQNLLLLAA
jgi:hypothetical protein